MTPQRTGSARSFRARVSTILIVVLTTLWPSVALAHGALSLQIEQALAAAKADPANTHIQTKLATLYIAHEEWENALAAVDRLAALTPEEPEINFLRGQAHLGAGNAVAAKASLDQFLSRFPTNAPALVLRARALRQTSGNDDALSDYRLALRSTPRPEPDLVVEVSDALAEAGNGPEALEVLNAAIRQTGTIPAFSLRALELECSIGRFDDALERIEGLRKCSPRPEPWMAQRAMVLTRAARLREARTAWDALLQHLAALPAQERTSHAFSLLAEQAREASEALSRHFSASAPSS